MSKGKFGWQKVAEKKAARRALADKHNQDSNRAIPAYSAMMPMPFGKHKGQRLCDIPPSYLRWALSEMVNLGEGLRYSMEAAMELQSRKEDANAPGPFGEIEARLKDADIPF